MSDNLKPGHTRIHSRALESLAQYIGAEVLNVDPREITTQLRDSNTKLGVTLVSGMRDTDLEICAACPDTTIFTFADKAARTFSDKMELISGYAIGAVDIRFTHIVEDTAPKQTRRVR